MNKDQNKMLRKSIGVALAGILVVAGLGLAVRAVGHNKLAFGLEATPQMTFQSPVEAATALALAAKNADPRRVH